MTTSMGRWSAVAVLYVFAVSGLHAQSLPYCDPSVFLPADTSCCTIINIMPINGGCCFLANKECRCDPAKTTDPACGATTTTTTTTTTSTTTPTPTTATTTPTTTTTAAPGLCPAVPTSRLLYSQSITNICQHNGVVGIYSTDDKGDIHQACNAVVLFNSHLNKREIVMSKACSDFITLMQTSGYSIFMTSQEVQFPLLSCNILNTKIFNETAVLRPDMVLEGFLSSISTQCDNTACVLDIVTMGSYIMRNTCYLSSYGASSFDAVNLNYVSTGLRRLDVEIVKSFHCGLPDRTATDLCVKPVFDAISQPLCQGDSSAGLFCSLSTGEDVFVGFVPAITSCYSRNKYVAVRAYDVSPTP